jgi:uncharacterized protein
MPEQESLHAGVVLRPIGSPLTVGLSGLGVASLVDSGLGFGWIPSSDSTEVGLVLLSVPFLLQLLACVLSYLVGDGAVGATVGVLATTWLAIGLLHLSRGGVQRDGALGLLVLAAGAAVGISAITICLTNPLAGTIFALAALRFVLDGVYQLGGAPGWQDVASIAGLAVSGLVLYAVPAFELEGQCRRAMLPTLRRARRKTGVLCDAGAQLSGVAREAGVRETS